MCEVRGQLRSTTEQAALADRVKPFATDGRFEQFTSTQNFDGPVHRRQHGFSAVEDLIET